MTTWGEVHCEQSTVVLTFLKTSYVNLTVLLFLIYASPVETKGNKWKVCQ